MPYLPHASAAASVFVVVVGAVVAVAIVTVVAVVVVAVFSVVFGAPGPLGAPIFSHLIPAPPRKSGPPAPITGAEGCPSAPPPHPAAGPSRPVHQPPQWGMCAPFGPTLPLPSPPSRWVCPPSLPLPSDPRAHPGWALRRSAGAQPPPPAGPVVRWTVLRTECRGRHEPRLAPSPEGFAGRLSALSPPLAPLLAEPARPFLPEAALYAPSGPTHFPRSEGAGGFSPPAPRPLFTSSRSL